MKENKESLTEKAFGSKLKGVSLSSIQSRSKTERCNACSAPICPETPVNLMNSQWYAGEDYCTVKKYSSLLFIKNQKRIAKRDLHRDGYYTFLMLNRLFIIRRGIRGCSPNISNPQKIKLQEENWIKNHPEVRQESIMAWRNSGIRGKSSLRNAKRNPSEEP